ncbi:hypothetical protein Q3G72_032252 [Acer saccharum]|nr:hypothetical protein Q3G72_032252 [Acer saccharum]
MIWVATVGNLETITKFITIAWLVWNNRNQTLFGAKAKSWGESWKKVALFLSDMKTNDAQAKATTNSPCEIKNWIPPNSGTFKVNVDAALDLERGKFEAGIVIRDHTGRILKVAALVFEGRVSVDIAEAKAIYEGLMLAKQSGLLPLSIESDSLTVVKLCNGEISTRSDVFNVISDIQIVVNREERILISHIPRICNRVAHEVARRAIGLDISVFFEDPFPPWLQMVALSNVTTIFSSL